MKHNLEKYLFWLFLATLLVSQLLIANDRLFWLDEIITIEIALLPSLYDVASALFDRVDHTPITYYVFIRTLIAIVGIDEVLLRLPTVFAYLGFSSCMYLIARRHLSAAASLLACIMPAMTTAVVFASEFRPYTLLLFFVSTAVLSWLHATDSDNRRRWLVCLTLSLWLAILFHTTGLIVIMPIVLSEIIRTIKRRRIDTAIVLSFVSCVIPFSVNLPWIYYLQQKGALTDFSYSVLPRLLAALGLTSNVLRPAAIAVFVCIFLAVAFRIFAKSETSKEVKLSSSDRVIMLMYLFFPLIFTLLPNGLMFGLSRYLLPFVIGFGWFLAYACSSMFKLGRNSLLSLVSIMLLCFVIAQVQRLTSLRESNIIFHKTAEEIQDLVRSGKRLVFPTGELFAFRTQRVYAAEDVRDKLHWYLSCEKISGYLEEAYCPLANYYSDWIILKGDQRLEGRDIQRFVFSSSTAVSSSN